MNRQNFDKNSVSNYPLTIDRMEEFQNDTQVVANILAWAQPLGNCILSGCEEAGDAGYVIMGVPDGNDGVVYEVFEVKKSPYLLCRYLTITESLIRAQNSDSEYVDVRTERFLEWNINKPVGEPYLDYNYLKRLRLEKRAQDDPAWVGCVCGDLWFAPTNGHLLRVQRVNGKVHVSCHMQYGLETNGSTYTVNGSLGSAVVLDGVTITADMTEIEIPAKYRPDGDLLVPVRLNGNVACAVLDSTGRLLFPVNITLGDILQIDTWLDI